MTESGDVGNSQPESGVLAPFFVGLSTAAALTAGTALLLYTGEGFLKTAGILLSIATGALAAGLWAGDDSSRSTRARVVVLMLGLLVSCVFAAKWTASPMFRQSALASSLAVLMVIALPGYLSGGALASVHRHYSPRPVAVQALVGGAVGFVFTTVYLIPKLDAWGVFFAASALLMPNVLLPVYGSVRTHVKENAMRGRVAIVTGVGAKGQLGYAVAEALLAAGTQVIIAGLSDEVRTLAQHLGARENVVGVRADLTSADGVSAVVAAAGAFGRLDALVNVAGGLTVIDTLEKTDALRFQREMSINAETVLNMSRACLPLLRESRGAIVNFASPAGERAVATLGAYSAAKAAVIALTRSLALEELAAGVRVNAIAPGMIDTDQNRASAGPDAKFVSREDVSNVVLFLVSDASKGITGQTIHVPGETLA